MCAIGDPSTSGGTHSQKAAPSIGDPSTSADTHSLFTELTCEFVFHLQCMSVFLDWIMWAAEQLPLLQANILTSEKQKQYSL
jgi:hypothetical protein